MEIETHVYGTRQHPEVAKTLLAIALCSTMTGDNVDAVAKAKEVLAVLQSFPAQHVRNLLDASRQIIALASSQSATSDPFESLSTQAQSLEQSGELAQAFEVYNQLLHAKASAYGQDHAEVASVMVAMTELLLKQRKTREALERFQLIEAIHPDHSMALHSSFGALEEQVTAELENDLDEQEAAMLLRFSADCLEACKEQAAADEKRAMAEALDPTGGDE